VAEVHPTAIVEAGAELDADVRVGPYAIIGANVRVGARTCVGSHTILEGWSEIGPDCQIGSHVIIGAPPQDLKYGGEATRVVIEERVIVREFASIHRASTGGEGVTRVGAHAYLMAYVHIAHNCQVGPHVVMANLASLAGHVEIGEHANIGAWPASISSCGSGRTPSSAPAPPSCKTFLPSSRCRGTVPSLSASTSWGCDGTGSPGRPSRP